MFRFNSGLALAIIFISQFSLHAGVLATLEVNDIGFEIGDVQQLPLSLFLAGDSQIGCFNPSATCILLANAVLTSADVGTTFRFDAGNPDFSAAVSLLADGIADLWSFSAGGGLAISSPLSDSTPPPPGVDFAGDVITEVDLKLNALTFAQFDNPISGEVPDAEPDVTITVVGTAAPEPSALPLVACGVALFLLVSRYRAG